MLRNLRRQSCRRKTRERHYCNVGGAQKSSKRKIAITHSPCQTTWSTYTTFFFLPQRYQRSHFFVLFALAGRKKNPDCRRRGRRPHSPWLLSPRSLDEEWDFVPPSPSPSDWGSHGPNATSWEQKKEREEGGRRKKGEKERGGPLPACTPGFFLHRACP